MATRGKSATKKKPEWAEAQFGNQPASAGKEPTGMLVNDVEGIKEEFQNNNPAPPAATVRPIPLGNLKAWDGNVRKTNKGESIEELAANIQALGVLTSLVVMKTDDGYAVAAGSRRLRALQLLLERRAIDTSFPVPCRVLDPAQHSQAVEISLAENVVRQGLNPVDEFEAFQSLAENGASVADIAARFGCGESTVKKRLKLANVSPKVIQAFREGLCTLNQLQAFAITDDHQAQEALAAKGYKDLETDEILDALNKGNVAATDKRVVLVGGIDALEKSGVHVERDLIEPERGYVKDKKALQRLVDEKLKQTADLLSAEGWNFVQFVKGGVRSYRLNDIYTDVPPKKIALSAADQKTLKEKQEQLKALDKIDWDQRDEDYWDKEEKLEAEVEALKEKANTWPDDVKAKSGVLFSYDTTGIEIRRGVKLKPAKKAKAGKDDEGDDDMPAAPAKPKEKSEAEKRHMTEAVMEELTAHRSFAISAAMIASPVMGLKVLAGILIASSFGGWDHRAPYNADLSEQEPPTSMHGKSDPVGYNRLLAEWKELKGKLPRNGTNAAIFCWALEQKEETLRKYLAVIAARTYADVNDRGDTEPETAAMLKVFNIDMTNWYTPTAKNLFGKLGQEQLKKLIPEIRGGMLTPAELKLGKDALADLAERECVIAEKAGRAWMPYPLAVKTEGKTTAPKAAVAKKPAAKANAKKKPAAAKKKK
jgi:ParB family chromosome partitioning protein